VGAKINLIVWIRSLQIFNAILLRFSRRLRNSPRPWVRHAQRPTTSDSLEKTHQKAKSSMSLNPYKQIYLAKFKLTIYVSILVINLAWPFLVLCSYLSIFSKKKQAWIRVNPGESHPEQRGHGSSRESRGERCEDRKGFPRWGWGKSLSFEGTYLYP